MSSLFVFLNVILYVSFAYLFFFQSELFSVKPLYWYIATLALGGILVIKEYGLKSLPYGPRRFFYWGLAFLILSILSYMLFGQKNSGALQGLIKQSESVLILLVFILLLRKQTISYRAAQALFVVVVAGVIINYIDFLGLSPVPLSKTIGRAAGMYVNANISGKTLALGMSLSVFVVPKPLRIFYCLFVFTGVLLTFSRSSIMMWCVVMLVLAWQQSFMLSRKRSLLLMAVAVFFGGFLLVAGSVVKIFDSVGLELNENATARVSGSFLSQTDESSMSRVALAKYGLNLFIQSPIVGKGVGLVHKPVDGLRAHNLYLQMAAEQGLIGIALMVTLLVILYKVKTAPSRAFLVGFATSCFFTHNMFDQPSVMILIAIAASYRPEMPFKNAARPRAYVESRV